MRSTDRLFAFLRHILAPERDYYVLVIVYGIGISLLSLATPIAVQMLVNTVANTGLTTPLVVLSISLFLLLGLAALLNAMRIHLMDLFARRFYARMVSEIALRAIYAVNPFFDDTGRGALFNRYFDIIIVHKTLPYLLIGGFTIVLQLLAGMALVSLYHPLFLIFNLLVGLFAWLVWSIWGPRAIESAVELSHRKHAAAAWLEGLGTSNGFYKSERHIDHALKRTDEITDYYISQHRAHFGNYFTQTLWYLFIYAFASALLLGLGGWLVIQGELTLGQLVAAELVLSVAFFSISQLGVYLTYFYDLCGAIDELSLFFDIEQEKKIDNPAPLGDDATLAFSEARGDARGMAATFDFTIPSGSRVLAHADNHAVQRLFTSFLKRHEKPGGGIISLGGVDLMGVRVHTLRQQIIVLDRPNVTEMTIREYLQLSCEESAPGALLQALEAVGLKDQVSQLTEGLDTKLAPTGWPLSITETMQLKLASAIIARPRLLVLNQLYDVMPAEALRRSLDLIREDHEITVMYFSNRECELDFDLFIDLHADEQPTFTDYESFSEEVETWQRGRLARMEPLVLGGGR
jgi:putative ABC transport system ATP-binding protein